MGRAKDIIIKVIPANIANDFVKRVHYSHKVVANSQVHFGAFLDGNLHGVMSFGCSTDKSKIINLVSGTKWNEFIELNRMAFDDVLPPNSESRAISIAIKLLKKYAPQVKWIISFADGTQCGDGTIYRASGFVLTAIKRNTGLRKDKNGQVYSQVTFSAHRPAEMYKFQQMEILKGYQLRYIYFIDKSYKKRLTVPIIPFSEIDKIGAGMYKGEKVSREERHNKKHSE